MKPRAQRVEQIAKRIFFQALKLTKELPVFFQLGFRVDMDAWQKKAAMTTTAIRNWMLPRIHRRGSGFFPS